MVKKVPLDYNTGVASAVFSGKYNYSTLTEVEKVDCPLKAFKAFLCCKALLPKVVRELAKNDTMFQSGMIINQLDTCDEYTGCYEQCAACIDFTCITCIFCGPKPGSYYMLENFTDKEAAKGSSDETFIIRENRTKCQRYCGSRKGFFVLSKPESEEPILMTDYKKGCGGCGGKTHYMMRDGKNNIVAAHRFKDACTCSIKGCMAGCCRCVTCGLCGGKGGCALYELQFKIQTPTEPTDGIPKWKNRFDIEPQSDELRIMGPTCFSTCCGKKHAKVEHVTYYPASSNPDANVAEETDNDGIKITPSAKGQDNRMLIKQPHCCAKSGQMMCPVFPDGGGIPGLEALETLAEASQMAADAQADGLFDNVGEKAVKTAAVAGGAAAVTWKKSKYDVTCMEFPNYFNAGQRAGLLMMALENSLDFK